MGWRERDWAKFTDEERRALYGVTPRRLSPWDPPPRDPPRADFGPPRHERNRSFWSQDVDSATLLATILGIAGWLILDWLGILEGPFDYFASQLAP